MLTKEEIEEIIITNMNDVSFAELACDEGFLKYLDSKIDPLFKKHNVKPFEIKIFCDKNRDWYAPRTNAKTCFINAEDWTFQELTVQDSYIQLLWILFHEAGHALYSDFELTRERLQNLGLKTDVVSDKDHLQTINDILYKIKNDYNMSYHSSGESPLKYFIRALVSNFQDAAEDKRIENKLLSFDSEFTEFVSATKAAHKTCDKLDKETDEILRDSEQEALKTGNVEGFESFSSFFYLTGKYGETGEKPDKRLYPCSYEAIPVIDKLMTVDDPDKEYDLALELVAIAYPLFEDRILFKTEEEEEEYFQRQALKKNNK